MLVDFLLGASIIALPQHQVPLAVSTAVFKATTALFRRSRRNKKPDDSVAAESVGDRDGSNELRIEKAGGQVLLQWDGLTCTLRTKDDGERVLLDGLCGEARPGRLLALMGPSGSGASRSCASAGVVCEQAGQGCRAVKACKPRSRCCTRV